MEEITFVQKEKPAISFTPEVITSAMDIIAYTILHQKCLDPLVLSAAQTVIEVAMSPIGVRDLEM